MVTSENETGVTSRRFEFNSVDQMQYFIKQVNQVLSINKHLDWSINWDNITKKSKVSCPTGFSMIDLDTLDMFYSESDDI